MKNFAWFALLLAVVTANSGGCCMGGGKVQRMHAGGCRGACNTGGGNGAACNDGSAGMSGHITYPYYTTRGPRDFFACNPGSPSN